MLTHARDLCLHVEHQAKDKKTRKFAAVKRMISPKDMRM